MEYASSAQMGLVHERIQAVAWLRDQVRSLEDATKQARASACKGFQAMNSPLNPPVIDLLSNTFQVEDRFLASKLCSGLPVVGVADISPFFEPYPVEATMSVKDFLASAPARRESLEKRILEEAKRAPRDLLMAVVIKIAAEVAAGTIDPRRALEELVVLHPPENKV